MRNYLFLAITFLATSSLLVRPPLVARLLYSPNDGKIYYDAGPGQEQEEEESSPPPSGRGMDDYYSPGLENQEQYEQPKKEEDQEHRVGPYHYKGIKDWPRLGPSEEETEEGAKTP